MSYSFTGLDITLILLIFVAIIIIAYRTSRNVKDTSDYFTAGRKFPWWMVAASYAVILLSSHDFLTYSQTGYLAGLTGMAVYLGACFGWTFLATAIQTPVLYYGGYYTITEWFERRFNTNTKFAGSIAVFIMMLALMGFNFYVSGIFLNQLFGINALLASMLAAVFVTIYVLVGGVLSIMAVNIFEGILIYVFGLAVVVVGLIKVGGPAAMFSVLPSSFATIFQPLNDYSYPLLGVLFGVGLASNGAWFFCNQANLQKQLSSRALNHARKGTMIFGLILMPIGALMTVWPGMIAKALETMGIIPQVANSGEGAILSLASSILGPGAWGLFIGALLCAMMSTADSYINSSATVFTTDIYKHFVKGKDDKHYLKVSRIAAIVCGVGVTYLMCGIFVRYELLMTALFSLFSAVMPGMLIVTVAGLLSWRVPPRAATACILSCIIGTFLAIYVPDIFLRPFVLLCGAPYPSAGAGYFNNLAGLVWGLAALLIFWPFSTARRKEELVGVLWNYPPTKDMEDLYFHALRQGKRGVVDLNTDEIQQRLSENRQKGLVLESRDTVVVHRNIQVKKYDEEILIGMSGETMRELGVQEGDFVIFAKSATGMSSARAVVKDDPELQAKNTVAVSAALLYKSNINEGDEVRVWRHDSWN